MMTQSNSNNSLSSPPSRQQQQQNQKNDNNNHKVNKQKHQQASPKQKKDNNNNNIKSVPVVPLSASSLSNNLDDDDDDDNNNTNNLEVLQTIPAQVSTTPGTSPPKKKTMNNSSSSSSFPQSSTTSNHPDDDNESASQNQQQQQQQQQNHQFFNRGPIPVSIITKHFEQRKLRYIKQLGDRLHLGQRGGDMYCSYVLTLQEAAFGQQLVQQYRTDSRHPGSVVVVCAIKHSDGIVEVETEYCDVGPVERLYQYIDKPNNRHHALIVAKAVVRQVLLALQTFNVVHSKVHRAVSSRTVLVRRDGCVKLGIFDAITREDFNTSNSYANKFLTSPFCAPECRPSSISSSSNFSSNHQNQNNDHKNSDCSSSSSSSNNGGALIGKHFSAASSAPILAGLNSSSGTNNNNKNSKNNIPVSSGSGGDFFSRMTSTAIQTNDRKTIVDHFMKHSESSKADVWSVGVLILSILLKDSLFGDSQTPASTSSSPQQPQPQPQPPVKSNIEILNELIFGRNNELLWIQIIPEASLRYLTRRCLEIDPKKRISLNDAVALTFIAGRTQGFRKKVFDMVPNEKEWKRKQLEGNNSGGGGSSQVDDNEKSGGEVCAKEEENCGVVSSGGTLPTTPPREIVPPWARYTEDPFSTPDYVPSDDDEESEEQNANGMAESLSRGGGVHSSSSSQQPQTSSHIVDTASTTTPTTTKPQKKEEVPLKDILATRHLSKLLDEHTIDYETKLMSVLPCCCCGAAEREQNNGLHQYTTESEKSRWEEIIQRHTRRVSVLLDLELRSQLTKRLNNPNGISHIEKQMKEVMKTRIYPAMRCLRAIVNDISTIRRQQQQQPQQQQS